ncbi:MAG: hypothetical protein U0T36_03985 [Saprospiraceae bacterium]|jgi:hypothetical protein
MTSKYFSFFAFSLVLSFLSCSKDDSSSSNIDCTGTTPKYSTEIATIMNTSCASAGCHDATTKAEGYNLSTYATVVTATKSSAFLKSIKHESGATAMPQGGSKLPDATIKIIQCWIQNGTPQ